MQTRQRSRTKQNETPIVKKIVKPKKKGNKIDGNQHSIKLGIKYRRKQKAKGAVVSDIIFRVPESKYEAALARMELPKLDISRSKCIHNNLLGENSLAATGPIAVSDNKMYEELLGCLENGDIEGFTKTANEALLSRKLDKIQKNDFICTLLTAVFYNPKAKENEVYKRCLETLFNTGMYKMGTADNILDLMMHCYPSI